MQSINDSKQFIENVLRYNPYLLEEFDLHATQGDDRNLVTGILLIVSQQLQIIEQQQKRIESLEARVIHSENVLD